MIKSTSIFTASMSALVIACAMAAFTAGPAAAQTAKKLKCTGCVKSKQIGNNQIKSTDIRDGQVRNADLAGNAVNSAKIQDGSIGLGDLGFDPATQAELDNTETLGGLNCANGQVAKSDSSGQWSCGDDVDTTDTNWSNLTGVPADIADGDDDTLGGLLCSPGDVPKPNGSGGWSCGVDIDTTDTDWNSLINVPADIADGDDDTLGGISCDPGQVAKWNGSAWDCAADVGSTGSIALLMTKIDNLAHLQARGASAYVFVTSETYTGNLGGVAGADDKCQTLADAAGLPGLYKAWIADSDPASAPASRFTKAASEYILPPGAAAGGAPESG